jgi:protein gp37
MGDNSQIEWTDATWPVVTGCTRVSPGCDHCYAFALHDKRHVAWKRGRWPDAPAQYHEPFSRVQLLEDRLGWPLKWRKPRRIFVPSMGDLFHEDVPDEFIARVFAVMALAPQHTFQVLTKRPERMTTLCTSTFWRAVEGEAPEVGGSPCASGAIKDAIRYTPEPEAEYLSNVWLGTSVENQAAADERIPHLLRTPAAVRFISAEPLLGPVDLTAIPDDEEPDGIYVWDALSGGWYDPFEYPQETVDGPIWSRIDWVIAGGESGPGARPCDVGWIRSLVSQCREAAVPVFVKQLGTCPFTVDAAGHVTGVPGPLARGGSRDHKGGDMETWPEDLRVREYPRVGGSA